MQKETVNEARFSLVISGEQLAVEDIEQGLGLKATRLIRRGEVLNRLPLIEAAEDEWLYAVPLTAHHGTDAGLNVLLSLLVEKDAVLNGLKAKYQVALRLYVQSDYAQMGYSLMPETLAKIVATGLPLDVSSLSWGEVKM
ncbi:MAG: DUF4279 domain-containing protein [Clostridia bacterium]|nr:DUF4279 domain-containing protein [Clostridia bacterium]